MSTTFFYIMDHGTYINLNFKHYMSFLYNIQVLPSYFFTKRPVFFFFTFLFNFLFNIHILYSQIRVCKSILIVVTQKSSYYNNKSNLVLTKIFRINLLKSGLTSCYGSNNAFYTGHLLHYLVITFEFLLFYTLLK